MDDGFVQMNIWFVTGSNVVRCNVDVLSGEITVCALCIYNSEELWTSSFHDTLEVEN